MPMADAKSLIFKLAHIYYHTGNWDKAIAEYEKILAIDPNDLNAHLTLGELYVKKGQLEKALLEFELTANGFLKEKNLKKAMGAFREQALLVQKLIEPQDLERAISTYKEILEKSPDSVEALANLRDLYLRHNHITDAISRTLQLGDLYNRLDYADKAEEEYARVCTLDPSHVEANQKLEKLRLELNKN